MGSILIYKGMPPLTPEQVARLEELKNMSDDEIDYSDIPKMTKEELRQFTRVNPRPAEKKVAN